MSGPKTDWRIWLFVFALLVVPTTTFWIVNSIPTNQDLPVLGPKTNDASGNKVEHRILDFELQNQMGTSVSLDAAEDKVVVAGFFFASCPTICPKMTKSLKRVQQEFAKDEVVIFYHSVDPKRDSIEVLSRYGERYGIDPINWHLLTGDKRQIYLLARNSYFVTAIEGDGGPTDFIHSELLVLVDSRGRIRGYYDGTDKESVDGLLEDATSLL